MFLWETNLTHSKTNEYCIWQMHILGICIHSLSDKCMILTNTCGAIALHVTSKDQPFWIQIHYCSIVYSFTYLDQKVTRQVSPTKEILKQIDSRFKFFNASVGNLEVENKSFKDKILLIDGRIELLEGRLGQIRILSTL